MGRICVLAAFFPSALHKGFTDSAQGFFFFWGGVFLFLKKLLQLLNRPTLKGI